jgi:hypothetical protein
MTDDRPQAKKGISPEEGVGEEGRGVVGVLERAAAFFARSKPLSVAALRADSGIVP